MQFPRLIIILTLLGIIQCNAFAQDWQLCHSSSHNISSDYVRTALIDSHETIWFGTNIGLLSYSNDSWNNFELNTVVYDLIIPDADSGIIWLATKSGFQVYQIIDADSIKLKETYTIENSGIASDTCYSIAFDGDGRPWVGTINGISVLVNEVWENLKYEANVLHEKIILKLQKRVDGFIYAATEGGGVSRLSYSEVDGISGASIIEKDWTALPSDSINTVYFDSVDKAWYGTNYGIATHTGTNTKRKWNRFSIDDGLLSNKVLSFCEDADSNMWIGTTEGVSVFTGLQWSSWICKDFQAGDSVNTIVQSSDGTIWLGTSNGILAGRPEIAMANNLIFTEQGKRTLKIVPNPVEANATISYYLPGSGICKLQIYSLPGKLMETIVESYHQKGFHEISYNAQILPKGMYILFLQQKTGNVMKKILVK